MTLPPRASETVGPAPLPRANTIGDVPQSVVFRKATLCETLDRDPSLGGDNFEGTWYEKYTFVLFVFVLSLHAAN